MIIVTGGAGFIGCNLIKRLNRMQKKNILVVDHLQNGKKYANLANLVIADYIDKDYFMQNIINNNSYYTKNIDVIFHLGACTSTTEWNGQYVMHNNYQYSKELLLYCIKHNISFIYASSASVYGKNTNTEKKQNNHQYETPINIYSYSKLLFDQYVRNTLSNATSQICGLRYFNIYGPYESHKKKMASIIFQIYQQIQDKKQPTLFSESKHFKRDFTYIDDTIDINLWVWKNKISGIFDCGTGVATSFESIAHIVLDFFNKKTIKYIPIPKKIAQHYQFFTQANTSQLQNMGYQKKYTDIKQGIHQYLNWLTKNLDYQGSNQTYNKSL